ncbi:TatD-related deoxyribonuclease [Halohasta litchfieldiae]|jgi:Predicted metal-dependent hydrolase (urease superfamily)|uniref:TatD-related deoxyribonuclease n=1 Tax=Halohasta litchfieldiae TaxID=1073996 RepID=A0A1H6V8T8_9EURY|nr:TatD family hydrolase [Halohasta litchfieldiae]ATW87551.1 TatD-related deoxyribonuclease [Halohasta litchfieldiae]SEI96722.1 TatD-related deoxyribonuclease [Halohasta litchfieldiae]
MEELATPVLDNHLHLDPERGRGMEAVDEFARLGGTHLMIVNQPSWKLGVDSTDPEDFRSVFETTVEIAADATERLPGRAWPIVGAHPGLISRLIEDRGCSPAEARDCMQGVLDIAADYVGDGRALGLKSGRPHYEVSDAVWDASNGVMKHAFSLGAEVDCAVQLHTEASEDLTEIADWAEERGLAPHKVVKHYAGGRLAGPTPSVMSNKDWIETAAESGDSFLMETDFIDDPDRPGAVLGPKTVPRRVRWLSEQGYDEAIHRAHVETPERVYGIDTESTLS